MTTLTRTIYQCSECYKCYYYWRWAARHLATVHDGYGVIEEYDANGLQVEPDPAWHCACGNESKHGEMCMECIVAGSES